MATVMHSEAELYEPVKSFFQQRGYKVKGEVSHCDLVALRDGEEPVIVELKRTFNLPLLIQGIDRLQQSGRVYLAVKWPENGRAPYGLKWNEIGRLCRMLGFGLLAVRFHKSKKSSVDILCEPAPYTPRPQKKKTALLLAEFQGRSGDYNVGGTNRRKLITAYREQALNCANLIRQFGPLSPLQLRKHTGNDKAGSILQRNFYRWFVRLERGLYGLAPEGEQALNDYAFVVNPE